MLFSDFLSFTKVLRMLYGTALATEYFEKHINDFQELEIKHLKSYKNYAKI